MWGISEPREPIKGEFAKKIIEEVARIREKSYNQITLQMKSLKTRFEKKFVICQQEQI